MMSTSSLSKRKLVDDYSGDHRLQFFVRILSGHTHVLRADPKDTIRTIHDKIELITGIPVVEQCLVYRGKQLRWDQTLASAGVQKDAGIHLVGRMRSTKHPHAWKLVNDVVSLVFYLYRNNPLAPCSPPVTPKTIGSMLKEFITMTPHDPGKDSGHLDILSASSAPAALVMLYMSADEPNIEVAYDAITHFINSCKTDLPKHSYPQCVPVVLDFCKLLRRFAGIDDQLYGLCRSCLGTMVECTDIRSVGLREVFPFVSELAAQLSKDLVASFESGSFSTIAEVDDLTSFMVSVSNGIKEETGFRSRLVREELCSLRFADEMINLHGIFLDLLSKLDKCLVKIDSRAKEPPVGGRQFLALLKELNSISKLYHGCEEMFWESMKRRKGSLCYLIVRCAKRGDDHNWISECKEVTIFEARRHLAMLLFPETKDDCNKSHEMLIDRAYLLDESFEYIKKANLDSLRAGLSVEFKNEEATGHGVLREWFLLVCQAIFNPDKNPLFAACPNDRTRFIPNLSSTVDPLNREYFNFVGKVIALALLHEVQVGIVFHRVFYQQLAEHTMITLEDIRDVDPLLYKSCKQILEMDAEAVDQDVLGLTFVHEIEELGTRRVVELCPGGESVVVNSNNRKLYVDSLIQHLIVKETAELVEHFAEGFGEIMNSRELQKSFFRCLDPDDLELMLRGSENEISVEDWKAHTDYNGFEATDEQIKWFWEIVGEMTKEKKKVLLFFWTSIKYLPSQGFGGLASRLYISKNHESSDSLPSSHTCFYGLCFPAYPSMSAMRKRLRIITQEYVSCSFGAG